MVGRDDDNVLKRALMLKVNGQRKQGRSKHTWIDAHKAKAHIERGH